MDESVRHLAGNSGPLTRILGIRDNFGRYDALQLVFERGTLLLTTDVDTDEIDARAKTGTTAAIEGLDEVDDPVLAPLLGKAMSDAWTLTNSRGFEDGFQIRLFDLQTRAPTCFQFEVAGSQMHVVRVSDWAWVTESPDVG